MKMSKLLALALVLLISVGTLAGSTIAWFTDEVTSTGNKIQAGNLKIDLELLDKDNTTWTSIKETKDPLFNYDKWEPGYTEVKVLNVKNVGNLALKWKAKIVPATEGEISKLAEAIDVYTKVDADEYPADRDLTGWTKEATLAEFIANAETRTVGTLEKEQAATLGIALKMREEAGNEYQGLSFGQFDIQILATQLDYESDSFGSDYDEDALYPNEFVVSTAAELAAAFAEGGDITLAADIELDEVLNVKEGANVHLDLNGKTITAKEDSGVDPVFNTSKGSTLVIDGNGTVELEDPSMSLIVPFGDVIIEDGTFVRKVPAGTPASQVGGLFIGTKVSPWGSQTVTINGGYFDGGYYNADAADIDEILDGTKSFTETADDIAKRGNSKDANAVRVAIKQNVQLTLNLSYNLFKVKGGTFVGMNPAWGDEGCMLPTTPNYLRPWSYYQGALLEGQTFHEDGIVLPDGYTITKGATADGRPTYTVNYSE